MEPNQITTEPAAVPATPTPEKPKSSFGALLGLVVVVLAIAAAALYFLNQRVSLTSPTSEDATLEALDTQGTSTDSTAIEADLDAKSPDEFDKELDDAFVELDASFDTAP